MDNNDATEFTARPYQIDLYERALKQNTIVYLPTSTGKTFIAVMLIKELSAAIRRPYGEGGKHTVFLVNSVHLVSQQTSYIKRLTGLECGGYIGDMGIDDWKNEDWYKELETKQVMVMTAQILLHALCHGHMHLNRINLLILDECHRAVNNHPMRIIMQLFKNCPEEEQPKVLGLTGSLLNGNVVLHKVKDTVRTLEITLHAKISSVHSILSIERYCVKPIETFIRFTKYVPPDVALVIDKSFTEMIHFLKCVEWKSSLQCAETSTIFQSKTKSQKLISLLNNMKEMFTAGLYAGKKCLLLCIIKLEIMQKLNYDADTAYVCEYLISEIVKIQKLVDDEMKDNSELAKIQNYSSDQIHKLLTVLLDFYGNKSSNQKFCCIIFVKLRITALILCNVLKNLSMCHESFKFLQPDYITSNTEQYCRNGNEKFTVKLYMHKKYKETLCRFRNGTVNCLIATDIIDEGIDIPTCTLIIRYDLPMDIRSYIQSRGRARSCNSQYTLLLPEEDKDYLKRYESFKAIELHLQQLIIGDSSPQELPTNDEVYEELYKSLLEPYIHTSNGKQFIINQHTAIGVINKYCMTLSNSKFTNLTPIWKLLESTEIGDPERICKQYQISLRLPSVSPFNDTIYGIVSSSIKMAKRSAALKMCIELHKIGELGDNLLPCKADAILNNAEYLFPNWEEEDQSEVKIIGTNKKKRAHKLQSPSALYGAYPLPSKPIYLHLLHANPVYSVPHYDNRYLVFYNLLCNKAGFGILTSKPMPSIPSFPIFMNVGELQVDVNVNYSIVNLSASEICYIKVFHSLIFSQVVSIIKSFMVFDNDNHDNCFLTVPVNEKWEISWETILQYQQIQCISPPVPFHFEPKDYHKLSVVKPIYRSAVEVYIVTEVCEDLTPNSCFPTENFDSYVHYYKHKHDLTINNLSQPLLEVKMLPTRINCIKPRAMQSESKYHKRMNTDQNLKEHFIPELCTIVQFPALYWLKATTLPSILHRISQLLIADDLRRIIAVEANLGSIDIDNCWPPLLIKEEEEIGEPSDSTIKIPFDENIEHSSPSESVLDGSEVNLLNTDVYHYLWKESQGPPDLYKNLDDIRRIDIEHYCQFEVNCRDPKSNEVDHKETKFMKKLSVPIPDVNILSVQNSGSPSPVQIMYALTSKHGHDAFNLERLEILGDTYLKFVISIFLYKEFPKSYEKQLTILKGKLLSNRNLYNCGNKKSIPGRMKVDEFVPTSNFIAPAYTVFRQLQQVLLDVEVSPNVLYEIQVSEKEQFSGCISEFTKNVIERKVLNWNSAETQTGLEHYLGMQTVSDKTVADCIEALIGVYLSNMGIKAAINLLVWFGILPKEESDADNLFTLSTNYVISEQDIDYFMPWAHDIEESLGYKFKNRALLLQAFTHSSYSSNTVTDSYERLEFLGDAIIDFLITCYIYEYCGNCDPGTITDLRSALVNNITFACLAVRYGLHTALLHYVAQLNEHINRFVKFQEERDHIVDNEILWILLEEDDCKMVQAIDVPKALADIFESSIGAIYLDCGKDLKEVWKILYSLMHKEIDEFSQNIPKQPLRVLYEMQGARPRFLKSVVVDDTNIVTVPLQVIIAGKVKVIHGFGTNKRKAKCAAAKLALKYLLSKS